MTHDIRSPKTQSVKAIFWILLITFNHTIMGQGVKYGKELMPANPPIDLNYRQIHLDFHNWGDYPDFLSAFDPEAFAETLTGAQRQMLHRRPVASQRPARSGCLSTDRLCIRTG